MKIRAKLMLLLLPPLLASGLAINHLTSRTVSDGLHDETAARITSGAERLMSAQAADLSSPLESKLLPFLYTVTAELNAAAAGFVAPDGTILAHTNVALKGKKLPAAGSLPFRSSAGGYEIPDKSEKGYLEIYIPVYSPRAGSPEELAMMGRETAKERLGTLIIDFPLRESLITEAAIARKNSLILSGAYLFILLAAFCIATLALRPIRMLTEGTRRIRLGDYDAVIPVSSGDEFGDLAASFNIMARTLSGTIVSRNYLDAIVDNMLDTLVVTDLDGVIKRTNRAARTVINRPETSLEGLGVMELFPWDNVETGGWLGQLRRTGEVRDHETVLAAGPGATVPVLVSSSFIKNTDGENSGIVVTIRDITERRKQEQELTRSNEDLQRFAFVASHDLQEPLRTVSSYIQLLENKYRAVLGPDSEKHVSFITGAVGRMRTLVRDLLAYSKINSSLHLEEVDTRETLDYVLAALQDTISAAGAVIERGEMPRIRADRGHLERIFQNLVSNAVKYRNGAAPLIRIGAERGAGGWTFRISDNGIGIESAYRTKLFKLFGRLHGNATDGAGIGLASCKKIVEYYGGNIWFESEPEKGSTFFFSIPDQP